MRFDVLTLHPELVRAPLSGSIVGRGVASGRFELGVVDMREHGLGRHRSVDDTPYGGGAGMVLRVDVVAAAIAAVRRPESLVLLTTPAGAPFRQADAQRLAEVGHLVLVCGHYEGVDGRVEGLVDGLLSLGDFVLTGGEIAAVAVVDAVARLLPGVLGNEASASDESFSEGLIEYAQYTRPRTFEGEGVPDVLLSGHHAQIEAWRRRSSEDRTQRLRPDLWRAYRGRVDADGGDE